MKFWKQIALSLTLAGSVAGIAFLSSCEKNSCDGVICYNGGSCGHGVCTCPEGWEDPQCGTRTIARYVGVYAGFTTCDNGGPTIDTVRIVEGSQGISTVDVHFLSIDPKVLHGYVENNESTYSITVTNNDSSKAGSKEYLRVFAISLQSDKTLKLHEYVHNITNVGDTDNHTCDFIGYKVVTTP